VFEDYMAEANQIIGAHNTGRQFRKSANLAYKWADRNPRQPDQSANTNPVQLMFEFLKHLAENGGLNLAVKINREFLNAITKEGN